VIPAAYKAVLAGERPTPHRSVVMPRIRRKPASVKTQPREFECVRCLHKFPLAATSYRRSYCLGCSRKVISIACKARVLTREAVKAGLLPDPTTLKCTDCHKQATVYDHRSYEVALKVEAVCDACNHKRGPAAFARLESAEHRMQVVRK
jgi:hypothetical protein